MYTHVDDSSMHVMSYVRGSSLNKINPYYRKRMVHCPDVVLFNHTAEEYAAHWATLSKSKYLWTNGYEIVPTNWFSYALQTVKGWFGYTNHCSTSTVKLALSKLAYYGYLSGFDQQPLHQTKHYPLNPTYLSQASNPRNDQSTDYLQHQLISEYVTSSAYNYNFPVVRFGDSWAALSLWDEIPALDPQAATLIDQTVNVLVPDVPPPQDIIYQSIPSSKFVDAAINKYINQAKSCNNQSWNIWSYLTPIESNSNYYLSKALSLNPSCVSKDLPLFIDYYIRIKQFKQAYDLIAQLPDLKKALAFVLKNENEFAPFITVDSPIAQQLTIWHLKQNEASKAAVYVSELSDYSSYYAFNIAVDSNDYEKAYTLFKTNPEVSFSKKHSKKLADYFANEGETLYQQGHQLRDAAQKNNTGWASVKLLYIKSLGAIQKAEELNPKAHLESVYTHKRLYAQLLIDENCAASVPNLKQLELALQLLTSCQSKDKEERQLNINIQVKGLMHQVDYLTSVIAVTHVYTEDADTAKEHNEEHAEHFKQLSALLNKLIHLLHGTKDKDLRLSLAKAHFILGDMKLFFGLEEGFEHHFEKAVKAAPNNPYYLLHASEHLPDLASKYQKKGLECFAEMDEDPDLETNYGMKFKDWWDNRWSTDQTFGSILSIHGLADSVPTSGLSSLFN